MTGLLALAVGVVVATAALVALEVLHRRRSSEEEVFHAVVNAENGKVLRDGPHLMIYHTPEAAARAREIVVGRFSRVEAVSVILSSRL